MKEKQYLEVWIGFRKDVDKASRGASKKPVLWIGDTFDANKTLRGSKCYITIHWCGEWWYLKDINGILDTVRHAAMFNPIEQQAHSQHETQKD